MKNKIIILGVVALLILCVFIGYINERPQPTGVPQTSAVPSPSPTPTQAPTPKPTPRPTPTPKPQCVLTLSREELVKLFNFAKDILEEKDYLPTGIMVNDINGDGFPEIAFNYTDGWEYRVCYYSNGEVREVGSLAATDWSTNLFTNDNGDIFLYTWGHLLSSEGEIELRIYRWDGIEYKFESDLFCRGISWEQGTGKPTELEYFITNQPIEGYGSREQRVDTPISKYEFDTRMYELKNVKSWRNTELNLYQYDDLTQVQAIEILQILLEPWDW